MPKRISTEDLVDRISAWESVSFECKGALNRELKERLSTYFAAFANTEGGLLVLGIGDSKETVGYVLKDGEREYISQQAENCRPPVYIDIEEREYDNNKIVLIYVPKGRAIHTDKYDRFPVRVGSNIDYLDITGLIQLAKERLGLTYGTERPEFPIGGFVVATERIKSKARPEEIKLCLNAMGGATKEVRLEGLRELELLVLYRSEVSGEPQVLEALETSLEYPEAEIRRNALDIIELMIRVAENDESRKELIYRYGTYAINLAKHDSALEVRSEAIHLLVEIVDERVTEPIAAIILDESDEIYNRLKSSFRGRGRVSDPIKWRLKTMLLKELGDPGRPENIRKRIRETLEEIRQT